MPYIIFDEKTKELVAVSTREVKIEGYVCIQNDSADRVMLSKEGGEHIPSGALSLSDDNSCVMQTKNEMVQTLSPL